MILESETVVPRLPRSRRLAAGEARGGSVLIVALGVLTLLSILGIAFASLMRLERKAAENYVDGKRMDLLLDSALDRVVANLQGSKDYRSFTIYKDTPWLYLIKGEDDLGHGRVPVEDPRVGNGRWTLFSQEEGQRGRYKTKVIDCAAQINLNGRQDTLARILDNLAQAIDSSARLKRDGKDVTNPLYTGPNRSGQKVRGEDIIRFRRLLPEGRFTSKSQLRWILGPENYETIKDFVTCYSWEDPYTYKPTDGVDEVSIFRGGTTGSSGAVGGGGQTSMAPASDTPRVDSEPRHPININTAPEEVLIAVLRGLAGRRVLPYSRLGSGGGATQPIDGNATFVAERIFGNEEVQNVTPRAIFVYSAPLGPDHAKRIADRIISERKLRPFMTWRTNNDLGISGFEDFVDGRLDTGFFPAPTQALVIDPGQPRNRQIETDVLNNATSAMGRWWRRGHDSKERQIRRQKGMAMHEQNAWYYDMMKGILKSNFNPNSRFNRYNPNAPSFIPVDKSDLVWAQIDRQSIFKGHTTEFCFDTMGFYEITALGRYEAVESLVPKAGRTTSTAADGATGGATPKPFVRPFDRKVRTVVKTYNVLRHTNQLHFERTFTSQSRSSKADRRYVLTYPEPMAALTDLYTKGSPRDGRVELAGLLDGERLLVDARSRSQLYRTHPSVLMAHGFQDRDPTSITKLQRVLKSGGSGASLFGDQVSQALREVLNANYSRLRSSNSKYVTRQELISLSSALSAEALHQDPLVQREVLGNDLMPDGIHSSILRTSHLQCRTLILPARQRLGEASGGGGNPLMGATGRGSRGTNLMGNVPYHSGGLAFWVKFDFNGTDPVFSGLIGCTQVIEEVSPAVSDFQGSEGTQFFIFRNTDGYLRVTRMYYHQAFYDTGGEGSDGAVTLYPDSRSAEGGSNQTNPIVDNLDLKKLVSRSDIHLDVRHFRAHEWHHIALDWNDQTNPTFPIKLFLDFQEVREGGTPRRAQAEVGGVANSWVRLNERQPRDGLQVCGIIRNQGVADAGVFKWFTNTSSSGGSGGGVTTVAESVKRILGNATIDELIAYEGDFGGAKQYYGASGSPGYFTTQTGEYANIFEIPVPPDVDSVKLRSFDWTSYYPVMFTDSRVGSAPAQIRQQPMECQIFYRSASSPAPAPFQEPWRTSSVANRLAGRVVQRGNTSIIGQNIEVVYKFRITGGRSNSGNSAGGVVGSPAIDDVTLTYYLTSPKILLQEDLD